jgi:hypothetical protein
LNLFCPTIPTSLFMLSTTLSRSQWKPLPPIDICQAHWFLTHSVIINICYILLVEDVRRMGEYCIIQLSDHNEGSLLMVAIKRKSRETKWPCTVSHWQVVATLREPHLKIPRRHIEWQNSHSNTWSLQ